LPGRKLKTAGKDTLTDSGAGSVIPGYSILARVGRGGMGAVFKAIQLSMNRLVALKILPLTLAKDKTYIHRFLREAKSAAQMNHPNLTRVYEVASYRGVFYFSMEFVDGATLLDLIKSEGRLDVETATDIALQAARGLRHAHSHSIVHRDIKPENIMIATDGTVKITDMGLAKRIDSPDHDITVTGQVIGTPCYMSPEQITNPKAVDARSDIYSLGATFYHMITGTRPFLGENSAQTMLKVVGEEPDWSRARVPAPVLRVVKRMMAKAPRRRYSSSDELIDDLLFLKKRLLSPHSSRRLAFVTSLVSPAPTRPQGEQAAIIDVPSRRMTLILAIVTFLAVLLAVIFRPAGETQPVLPAEQAPDSAVAVPEPDLSFSGYFNEGLRLGREERWENALAYFKAATKANPDSYDAWNNCGTCQFNLGRFEEAVFSYEEALDLNPESADTRVNRGAALLAMGEIDSALKDFESAIETKPDFHAAWTGKAIALRRLRRHDEARETQIKADLLKRK
jgi:serine/threonine-protein kinase